MDGYKIALKFTVGVGEHTLQMGYELRRAALKRAQEQALLVIVVSMDIVPEHWGSLQDLGNLLDGVQ